MRRRYTYGVILIALVLVGFLIRVEMRSAALKDRGIATLAVPWIGNKRLVGGYDGELWFNSPEGNPIHVECVFPDSVANGKTYPGVRIRYLPEDPSVLDFPDAPSSNAVRARLVGQALGMALFGWLAMRLFNRTSAKRRTRERGNDGK